MKLLSDNLKKAGYFNAALIIVAILFRLYFITVFPIATKIDSIICIAALIFGLFYSLSGYKKDAAKYYKAFMYLYLISSIFSLVASCDGNVLSIIANVIILVSAFILSFVKDLGEKKSDGLALVILAISIFKLCIVTTKTIPHISVAFANLMLACILCVFVAAKYADKKSRGAK